MSDKTRHLRWVAPVALVGALGLAACGSDGDDAADARTGGVGAVAVGSDRHLENLAAEIGQTSGDGYPNVFEAGNRAVAEAREGDGSVDEFVPGSRRTPLR